MSCVTQVTRPRVLSNLASIRSRCQAAPFLYPEEVPAQPATSWGLNAAAHLGDDLRMRCNVAFCIHRSALSLLHQSNKCITSKAFVE